MNPVFILFQKVANESTQKTEFIHRMTIYHMKAKRLEKELERERA